MTGVQRVEPGAPSSVLNACRAWRCTDEGVLSSMDGAAAWARDRLDSPGAELVDRALEPRRSDAPGSLDGERVRALLRVVRGRIAEAAT